MREAEEMEAERPEGRRLPSDVTWLRRHIYQHITQHKYTLKDGSTLWMPRRCFLCGGMDVSGSPNVDRILRRLRRFYGNRFRPACGTCMEILGGLSKVTAEEVLARAHMVAQWWPLEQLAAAGMAEPTAEDWRQHASSRGTITT